MIKYLLFGVSILCISACSGIRTTEDSFATHAESFNILFLQIPPRDAQAEALAMVPQGGQIISMQSTPDDLSSLISIINRMLGIDYARVEGRIEKTSQ